jgi:hypothetical protein
MSIFILALGLIVAIAAWIIGTALDMGSLYKPHKPRQP